jgi:hypothetical protein
MIAGSNKDQEKPRYEAPELLSLGEMVRGVAICEYGSTPSGSSDYCTEGFDAFISCADGMDAFEDCINGEYAWHGCGNGYVF